jgi:DNA-binding MarR family transcriptional regulator/N-acetylglutamate synthase-like GNAT family acetyltransferase
MVMKQHPDVLKQLGPLALGSRLKRLAERLQNDAAALMQATDSVIQPSHFPLIACLDRFGPVSVGEASQIVGVSQPAITRSMTWLQKQGLVGFHANAADSRQKMLSLTETGQQLVENMASGLYPAVESAAGDLCAVAGDGFLGSLDRFEVALDESSLYDRAMKHMISDDEITLVDFTPDLVRDFREINLEWIDDLFDVEEIDLALLNHPEEAIIKKGGHIVFARSKTLGVVGTGALLKHEDGVYELSKMGVLKKARGRKAGKLIIEYLIAKARELETQNLFLITNWKCAAAIHLYEKHGFVHDEDIMNRYAKAYERANVAMRCHL